MKNKIKEIVPYIIIIVVVALLRIYVITPEIVSGDSMENTLHDGEEVEDGYAKNDTTHFSLKDICYSCEVIPKDKYLVLGDNREISADSRSKELGLVSKNNITGKAVFRLWPLNKFGLI